MGFAFMKEGLVKSRPISVYERRAFIVSCIHDDPPDTRALLGAFIALTKDTRCAEAEVRAALRSAYVEIEKSFLKEKRSIALVDARAVGDELDRIAVGATARKDILHALQDMERRHKEVMKGRSAAALAEHTEYKKKKKKGGWL